MVLKASRKKRHILCYIEAYQQYSELIVSLGKKLKITEKYLVGDCYYLEQKHNDKSFKK